MVVKARVTFSSLGYVNYRRYFTGHALSITGSRVDKRRLLLLTQSLGAGLALGLAVLVATGLVQVWMVFALAAGLGVVHAIDRPARQAIIMEMVSPDLIANAVTLNNITWNAAQAVGPALAGSVIAAFGLAASFFLDAASYLAVIVMLLTLRAREPVPSQRLSRSRGQLREGFSYVRRTPELLAPMIVLVIVGMFAFEWAVTLPLLAEEAFGGDAQTFGWMFSSMGSGAVIGGLVVAGSVRSSPRFLAGSSAIFGLLLLLTAAAPTLPFVLVGLFLVGSAGVALRSTAKSVLQAAFTSPDARPGGVAVRRGDHRYDPIVGAIGEFSSARVAIGLGGLSALVAAGATVAHHRRTGYGEGSDSAVENRALVPQEACASVAAPCGRAAP